MTIVNPGRGEEDSVVYMGTWVPKQLLEVVVQAFKEVVRGSCSKRRFKEVGSRSPVMIWHSHLLFFGFFYFFLSIHLELRTDIARGTYVRGTCLRTSRGWTRAIGAWSVASRCRGSMHECSRRWVWFTELLLQRALFVFASFFLLCILSFWTPSALGSQNHRNESPDHSRS